MSTVAVELDGLCPLVDDVDDVATALSADDLGAVAVDVIGASVVTVAVGVVPVDTTTTVDLTSGVLAVEELIILVVTGGDAGRYGSVTSMYPDVVVTTVDVAVAALVVGAVDATTPDDDVLVVCFLDGVLVVGANSDASSEMTTASWNSISSSGIGCAVIVGASVATCCCRAASSSGVSSGSTSGKSKTGCSSSTSKMHTPCSSVSSSVSCDISKSCSTLVFDGRSRILLSLSDSSSIWIVSVVVASAVVEIGLGTIVAVGRGDDVTLGSDAGSNVPRTSWTDTLMTSGGFFVGAVAFPLPIYADRPFDGSGC